MVEKLCALENTESGLLFSSGMAAISTTLRLGDAAAPLHGEGVEAKRTLSTSGVASTISMTRPGLSAVPPKL